MTSPEAEANQYKWLYCQYNSSYCIYIFIVTPIFGIPVKKKQTKLEKNICLAFLTDTPNHLVVSRSDVVRPVLHAWHNRWYMFLIRQIYSTYPSVKEPIKISINKGRPDEKRLLCRVTALPLFLFTRATLPSVESVYLLQLKRWHKSCTGYVSIVDSLCSAGRSSSSSSKCRFRSGWQDPPSRSLSEAER